MNIDFSTKLIISAEFWYQYESIKKKISQIGLLYQKLVNSFQWNSLFIKFIVLMKNSRIYRYKTMADKLMYIPNDDTQNSIFCKLQLLVEIFGHSI